MDDRDTILKVSNLCKYFKVGRKQILKAVDNVSFEIKQGETLGLVGESGCGKSTTGRTIVKLYEPTAGKIFYEGKDVSKYSKKEFIKFNRETQIIFQDPYASLNPRMTVTDIVGEGIDIHNLCDEKDRQKRIYKLLEMVGLSKEHANRFPHEFSGGQRQRIGIARALSVNPKFIVCDEAISALDVSIQAQVVNLLKDLQEELNLTYLFIAHDLSMVKYISDKIAVMYLGSIVEIGESSQLNKNPLHPYTKALLSSIPIPDPDLNKSRKKITLKGDVPSPINPKPGCKFQDRCIYCTDDCRRDLIKLKEVEKGRFVACNKI